MCFDAVPHCPRHNSIGDLSMSMKWKRLSSLKNPSCFTFRSIMCSSYWYVPTRNESCFRQHSAHYIYISLEAKGEIVTVVTVELGRTVTNMNDGGRKYPALYLNVIYLFQMHQYLVLPGAVCGVAFFVCSLSTVVVDARTLK